MQRPISLFREPVEGYPAADFERPPDEDEPRQPLYFVQLLNYLREQKESADARELRAQD